MNEATFVLMRMAQSFEKITSEDEEPWRENLTLTLNSSTGCKVKLWPS